MRGIWIWVSTLESIKAAVARPAPELPPPASFAYRGTTESSSWKPKRAAKATRVSRTTGRVSRTSRSVVPVVCAGPFTPLTLPAAADWEGLDPSQSALLSISASQHASPFGLRLSASQPRLAQTKADKPPARRLAEMLLQILPLGGCTT